MSKFELIKGKLSEKDSNLRFLADEYALRKANITQKEILTFAYHYLEAGNEKRATSLLNRVSESYFTYEIYKDLYKSLLAWHIYGSSKEVHMYKCAEYFLVIKRSIPLFKKLEFENKASFLAFSKDFYDDSTFTS